jgi:hypothetical protein
VLADAFRRCSRRCLTSAARAAGARRHVERRPGPALAPRACERARVTVSPGCASSCAAARDCQTRPLHLRPSKLDSPSLSGACQESQFARDATEQELHSAAARPASSRAPRSSVAQARAATLTAAGRGDSGAPLNRRWRASVLRVHAKRSASVAAQGSPLLEVGDPVAQSKSLARACSPPTRCASPPVHAVRVDALGRRGHAGRRA